MNPLQSIIFSYYLQIRDCWYNISDASYFKVIMLFTFFFIWGIFPVKEGGIFYSTKLGQSTQHEYVELFYSTEEEIDRLNRNITQLLEEQQFNGNILISRYGLMIYERSMGYAHFNKDHKLDIHTSFQLASISKTFTSAAILLLHEQGLLSVEDTVQKHIPEFPYDNITIRHLLSHSSGLQNYMWMVERYWHKAAPPNNEDILQLFLKHRRPLNFRPGAYFDYSNTGFVFLGLLIERVSGRSFAQFIEENIFAPLEMDNSFVNDLHDTIDPPENRAYGFRQWRGSHILIPDDDLDGPLGDKGIFSTVHDLHKWDQSLYRNTLLSKELTDMAFAWSTLNNDTVYDYGLGWRLQEYLDKKIVHHPGRWHGFRTSFKRFINDHTTIIVLSNNNRSVADIIDGIQDILYYDEKEIWMAHKMEQNINDTIEPESMTN